MGKVVSYFSPEVLGIASMKSLQWCKASRSAPFDFFLFYDSSFMKSHRINTHVSIEVHEAFQLANGENYVKLIFIEHLLWAVLVQIHLD